MYNIALKSEGTVDNVSEDDRIIRDQFIKDLKNLPKEIIINLRELQVESGCFNQCSFCGVSAGKIVFRLNKNALANLFAGVKFVALQIAELDDSLSEDGVLSDEFKMPKVGLVGYGSKKRRVGAIYPYEDNDVTSYPFLDQYVKFAFEDLGVKTRITTVGYSRANEELQKMNENLNRSHLNHIEALRFSFTPYTFGWITENNKIASRANFIEDLANTLKTYKPMVNYLLNNGSEASLEFRFRSLICGNVELIERIISKKHVIHVGPYLLISISDHSPFTKSVIDGKTRHSIKIDGKSRRYFMFISDSISDGNVWLDITKKLIDSNFDFGKKMEKEFEIKEINLFMFENYDGIYYSANPIMDEDGLFAKHFYPKTERRPCSGYIDSERYFLNILLAYKKQKNIKKMELFEQASFSDVDKVVILLRKEAEYRNKFDVTASNYIKTEILPLVEGYVIALRTAGYEARYFFNPYFTINAGSIRNLGRAFFEYKLLASKPEMVVTSEHESRYGRNSFFAEEGKIWRIAPMPSRQLT